MSDDKRLSLENINIRKMLSDPTMMFAILLIAIVLMLIIPVPAFMLDVLMSVSILSGIMIVLTVSYLRKAVDFSIFPSLLLVTTIFRLAVNVSSTRLILSKGADFDGKMVRAFGKFVVGSSDNSGMVIGVIIFTILVIVQFIVITRGATRVSEVAARFSLDSMPNKYMAIDMDLQNGVINEQDAIARRAELQEESSFYGNMDGASKFVQGDVIVGIIITIVNVVGGFSVGMAVRGESFDVALNNYIVLTIGDGLVSQIPSLLISFGTGLIVTRSTAKDAIGMAVWQQITKQNRIFFISSGALAILALLPGFPHIVLVIMAAAMGFAGYVLYNAEEKAKVTEEDKMKKDKDKSYEPEDVSQLLKVDPLTLYIGYELIPLVDKSKNAELLNSIAGIRRSLALELGIVIPPIRIQDNIRLAPNEYSFNIRGQEIGKGAVKTGYLMAMGQGMDPIEGASPTTEPAFGLPAYWIREDNRDNAENMGYTVVDTPTIISTYIQELIKQYAHEIMGREETSNVIESVKRDYPVIVEDVVKDFPLAKIQKVFQLLLAEGVSIRDMATVLETLTEHSPQTPVYDLTEFVRQALKRVICAKYKTDDNKLYILRIDPDIENAVYKNMETESDGEPVIRLKPEILNRVQMLIKDTVERMFGEGYALVIVTQPPVRKAFWEICQYVNRNIAVLSTRELVSDMEIVLFDQITAKQREEAPVGG